LIAAYGELAIVSGQELEWIPLRGMVPYVTLELARLSSLLVVALPALLLLFFSIWLLWRKRGRSPAVCWLFLNSVLVVLMPFIVYQHVLHASRNAGGLVLSAVFVMPLMAKWLRSLLAAGWVLPNLIWLLVVLRWAPWLSLV
jgi:hypothetical protein